MNPVNMVRVFQSFSPYSYLVSLTMQCGYLIAPFLDGSGLFYFKGNKIIIKGTINV